jgi:aminopeptidase N
VLTDQSWFGNGIGCASWCHFWLNESWTTYLERLLVRETEGEAARQLYVRSLDDLAPTLKV